MRPHSGCNPISVKFIMCTICGNAPGNAPERLCCIADEEFAVLRFTEPSLCALIRAHEYEDWTRGRIVFDQSKDRFVLYADRKLMLPGTIPRIQKRFSISAGQRRWRLTFTAKAMSVHENSRATLSPRSLLSSAIPHLYGLRAFRELPSSVCRQDFHGMRIARPRLYDLHANPTNISPDAK